VDGRNVDVPDITVFDITDAQRHARTQRLLDTHHQSVFRYAYRLTGCSASAEDIAQEVFLRAFRSIHQLRDDRAERGWLLVITRNEFNRWCRKSQSTCSLDASTAEIAETESNSPQLDDGEWVQRAIAELPAEFRIVLLMFYFEELSYAEIARQLDIPLGTVMSRLSRGKSHLKTALETLASAKKN
jgi:RNA polymerase sigma-70 factor (ECF subfamily)